MVNRKVVDIMEAERFRIERRGVKQAATFGFRIRMAAMEAYRRGEPVGPVIRQEVIRLRPAMLDAMENAHLQGRLRSAMNARKAGVRRLSLANVYQEATDFVQRRLDLSDDQLIQIRNLYTQAVASFSGDLAGSLERFVGEAVAQATREGLHTRGGMRLIREAFDKAGVTPTNSYQVESIYRTQTSIAYNAGRWNANQDPDIQEILWGFEYATVADDRVRPEHAAMDGFRAPKDDPRWREIWPPNGWGCRCYVPGTPVSGTFVAGSKALYSGPVIELETARGRRLTVTPNHPIATTSGMVNAGDLRKGDTTICDARNVDWSSLGSPDDQNAPASIEDVFESFGSHRASVHARPLDFHGDASCFKSDIDVVSGHKHLACGINPTLFNRLNDLHLVLSDRPGSGFPRLRKLTYDGFARFLRLLPLYRLGSGRTANVDSGAEQRTTNGGPANVQRRGNGVLGLTGLVSPSDFVDWAQSFGTEHVRRVVSAIAKEWDNGADIHAVLAGNLGGVTIGHVLADNGGLVRFEDRGGVLLTDHTGATNDVVHRGHRNSQGIANSLARLAGLVEVDRLVSVRVRQYHGHVFDLQSTTGLMSAGGIIASNCSTIEIFTSDREARPTQLPEVTKDEYGNTIPVRPDDGWAVNVGLVLPDGVAA